MNYAALIALAILVFSSGCTAMNAASVAINDSINSDQVANDLSSVLVDESEEIELGELI